MKITLPLSDFLQSGYLSNGNINFLLHEEDDDDGDPSAEQQQQCMENRARLALLLTRAFVHQVEGGELQADYGGLATSFQLSNIYLSYEEERGANSNGRHIIILHDIMQAEGVQEEGGVALDHTSHSSLSSFSQMEFLAKLGGLLYSIFAQGHPLPAAILSRLESGCSASSTVADDDNCSELIGYDDFSIFSRTSQRSRTIVNDTLRQLADTAMLPIPVCRFLTDMIDADTGPDIVKTTTPFTSLGEVVQEVEDMIAHPETFLHYSYAHEPDGHLKFNDVHCGREEEALAIMSILDQMEQPLEGESSEKTTAPCTNGAPVQEGIEAVFIMGKAGSGKSSFARVFLKTLSSSGWIVLKAKFDQRGVHHSAGIVTSMFDQAVMYVVNMRDSGDPDNVAYSEQVSKSILDSIGRNTVRNLMYLLPSLSLLFSDVDKLGSKVEIKQEQLIYPLSSILKAVLEPRRFMVITCDDLQFADQASLSLLGEVLISLGGIKHVCRRCMFLGLVRDDEVDDHHPFSIQYSYLGMSSFVNTTETKLSALSSDHIVDMMMQVFRLPRRVVIRLANLVFKKTAGHALFVREFLNSLLQDSIISYSSEMLRYTWDLDTVEFLPTNKNVAGLIAANLDNLPDKSKRFLKILSLFGIQTNMSILQALETFQEGFISALEELIDMGILDQAGPIVMFTHDLILQSIYDGITTAERMQLHYEIGIHLGKVANSSSRSPSPMAVESNDFEERHQNDPTLFTESQNNSSLLALACDQIALAQEYITDDDEKRVFAQWNLISGERVMSSFDFPAAIYYFDHGISFLPEDGSNWEKDRELSMALYHGAVSAAFSLSSYNNCDKVTPYKEMIEKHVSFDERLDSHIVLLQAMVLTWDYEEGFKKCTKILEHFNVHTTFEAIADPPRLTRSKANQERYIGEVPSWRICTDEIASQLDIDDVVKLCEKYGNERTQGIIKIFDILTDIAWVRGSLMFPAIVYEAVRYSLTYGVSQESAPLFALYAMMKIRFDSDYEGAKKWATITRAVLQEFQAQNQALGLSGIRALVWLNCLVETYWTPWREVGEKLLYWSDEAHKIGDKVMVGWCTTEGLTFKLLHGSENLALISNQLMSLNQGSSEKLSEEQKKVACNDWLLLYELMGYAEMFLSSFGISSIEELQLESEFCNNLYFLFRYQVYSLLRAYWKGDLETAEKFACSALSNPASQVTSTVPFEISLYLFGGIISFVLYRRLGGEERLEQGTSLLAKLEELAQNAMDVFENKLFLLHAEHHFAVTGKSDETENMYRSAIKAAQERGNISELALAYELLGHYFDADGLNENSRDCFSRARVYYNQWGAIAKVTQLENDHNLDLSNETTSMTMSSAKRNREGS